VIVVEQDTRIEYLEKRIQNLKKQLVQMYVLQETFSIDRRGDVVIKDRSLRILSSVPRSGYLLIEEEVYAKTRSSVVGGVHDAHGAHNIFHGEGQILEFDDVLISSSNNEVYGKPSLMLGVSESFADFL
jgi:hypothetical protein